MANMNGGECMYILHNTVLHNARVDQNKICLHDQLFYLYHYFISHFL